MRCFRINPAGEEPSAILVEDHQWTKPIDTIRERARELNRLRERVSS